MLLTRDLVLRALPAFPGEIPRCQLLVAGDPSGPVLGGVVLEGQFALGTERLVLITHDCPYEESLDIMLFDARFAIIDQLSLGYWYTPGMVSAVEAGPSGVEFSFFGDERWRLTVLAKPRWMLPRRKRAARRPLRLRFRKHRLRLDALP